MTAAAALLFAVVIWASNAIMVKLVLREVDPLTLTWLRFLVAGAVYVPFALATRRRAPAYTARERLLVLGGGLALVPVFSLALYGALTNTTVANTALVRMTEPAWALLLAALLLGERPARRQLAGMALAMLGTTALVLLGRAPAAGGTRHVLGMAFAVLAALAWVGYMLCFKDLLRRHDMTQVTVHAALVGTLALLLVTGPTHAAGIARQALAMSALAWTLVVTMGLVVTIASNQLFSFGLQRVPTGVAAAYAYLTPVVAAWLAWLVLGEPITPAAVVCGLVIAAGVYLVNRA